MRVSNALYGIQTCLLAVYFTYSNIAGWFMAVEILGKYLKLM